MSFVYICVVIYSFILWNKTGTNYTDIDKTTNSTYTPLPHNRRVKDIWTCFGAYNAAQTLIKRYEFDYRPCPLLHSWVELIALNGDTAKTFRPYFASRKCPALLTKYDTDLDTSFLSGWLKRQTHSSNIRPSRQPRLFGSKTQLPDVYPSTHS